MLKSNDSKKNDDVQTDSIQEQEKDEVLKGQDGEEETDSTKDDKQNHSKKEGGEEEVMKERKIRYSVIEAVKNPESRDAVRYTMMGVILLAIIPFIVLGLTWVLLSQFTLLEKNSKTYHLWFCFRCFCKHFHRSFIYVLSGTKTKY